MFKHTLWILLGAVTAWFALGACVDAAPSTEYRQRAEKVAANVYAVVSPLGQRSAENDDLNANFGFTVTRAGVILIDSSANHAAFGVRSRDDPERRDRYESLRLGNLVQILKCPLTNK